MDSDLTVGEVSSLLDMSIKCVAANMLRIQDIVRASVQRGPVFIDQWIMMKILKPVIVWPFSTAQLRCLEAISPCMCDDDSVDNFFWKSQVERKFMTRAILYPFPDLVEHVTAITSFLQNDSISEEDCLVKLYSLRAIPFSSTLGKRTGVGVVISKLSKRPDQTATVIALAAELTRKWKAIHKAEVGVTDGSAEAVATDIQLAAHSTQITTWRHLYYFCEQEEEEHFQRVSQRIGEKVKHNRDTKRTCHSAGLGTLTDEQRKKMVRLDMHKASSEANTERSELVRVIQVLPSLQ